MLDFVRRVLQAAEGDARVRTRTDALKRLQALGLEDFGQALWSMPDPQFPRLSALLPRMATEDVQRNWTGNAGEPLLLQTALFVRSVAFNYTQISGRPLRTARVLDYGCGYGRVMRLLYHQADESNVVGVDPWDRSVAICREDGLLNVSQSEYLPRRLPVTGKFHLMFAFSVFTHTSQRATTSALAALREYAHQGGVLVITIRPIEYWLHHADADQDGMQLAHQQQGFAFFPHQREAVSGDVTYGDTSMTTQWLEQHAPQWRLVAEDRTLYDPFQRYLFLTPV